VSATLPALLEMVNTALPLATSKALELPWAPLDVDFDVDLDDEVAPLD
jgi:hypothetical protein